MKQFYRMVGSAGTGGPIKDETLIIAEAKLYKYIDQKVLYRLQQINHEMSMVVFKRSFYTFTLIKCTKEVKGSF